jgi:hypothetical protein
MNHRTNDKNKNRRITKKGMAVSLLFKVPVFLVSDVWRQVPLLQLIGKQKPFPPKLVFLCLSFSVT